jgi:hypothetical protein
MRHAGIDQVDDRKNGGHDGARPAKAPGGSPDVSAM